MRKALMATSALAFAGAIAAAPASAADMLSVGVGGYMQQWFGYANRDDDGEDGGWDSQSDSEVHVKGSLEADNGLKYTVHVELEGNQNADGASEIDESFVRVSGDFGQLEMGARDHALVRMHYGISDVGVGLTSGDTQKWIPGTYLETAGHAYSGGDDVKLNYISPRMNGIQVGVSYAPDQENENAVATAPAGNDNASWGAAVNFSESFGDGTVLFSLGHQNIGKAASEIKYMTGMAPPSSALQDDQGTDLTGADLAAAHRNMRITAVEEAANKAAIKKVADLEKDEESPTAAEKQAMLNAAAMNERARDGMTMKGDDAKFTNVGVGISMGAFTFNVAYATMDGNAYKTAMGPGVAITAAEVTAITALDGVTWTYNNGADNTAGTADDFVIVDGHMWDDPTDDSDEKVAESATSNDPANDRWVSQMVVEDKSKSFDAWGVSVTYTDGPMAISLGHLTHEADDGGERTATMVSASYNLAPGVDWKTSVFGVEDTTGHANVTGGINEGTGFVTGITLGF